MVTKKYNQNHDFFVLIDVRRVDCKLYFFLNFIILYKDIRFPMTTPPTNPMLQVLGHTCQGRSQSKGMGKAPNQEPINAPIAFAYIA